MLKYVCLLVFLSHLEGRRVTCAILVTFHKFQRANLVVQAGPIKCNFIYTFQRDRSIDGRSTMVVWRLAI